MDLPDPGIEPTSFTLAGGFFTAEPPGELRGDRHANDKMTDTVLGPEHKYVNYNRFSHQDRVLAPCCLGRKRRRSRGKLCVCVWGGGLGLSMLPSAH